ncbi:MAG: efflux RND transporter periplasmic adaptor subunit [Acidobacteria bacterium]|nr:efflux RND transporter periplasmic adaptor subunit [Acidobacteriota bacterium]
MAKNNRRMLLVLFSIAVAVILLAAFASMRGNDVPIRAARVVRENVTATIVTNGKIEPIDNFEAHAPAPATVKRVLVQQGDHVKAGQLLLQLDDADARAQAQKALAQLRGAEADLNAVRGGGTHEEVLTNESELIKARGDLDGARRNYEALQGLLKTGAASSAEVDQAKARMQAAQAHVSLLEQKKSSRFSTPEVTKVVAQEQQARSAYDAAQDLLQHLSIRAPRAGIVYSLPVRAGNYINGGDLLVQVANLSQVQVRAFVDEPEIGRLAPSEPVTVTWDALPGRSWSGTLSRVPTTITMRGTRSVGEITCMIANPDMKLLPNVNVNVTVTTALHENVLTVPREAIRQDDGQRYVFQVVNGVVRRRNVQTSLSSPTRIEVDKGLGENSLVALGSLSAHGLRDGMGVRVVQQ